MSLIALACAKGSPGVTVATLALATTWPSERPVLLVEADPAGGDLAGRLELPPTPNLLTLAAARQLDLGVLRQHTQTLQGPGGQVEVLLGIGQPEQAGALPRLWPRLLGTLEQPRHDPHGDNGGQHDDRAGDGAGDRVGARAGARAGERAGERMDVLADCGQLSPHPETAGLLRAADRVLLVARPVTEQLRHLRTRLDALAEEHLQAPVEVLLVGERPYSAADVAAALGVPVVGVLPDDAKAAAMLAGQPATTRRLGAAILLRSRLVMAAADLARQLAETTPPGWRRPPAATGIPSAAAPHGTALRGPREERR